MGLLNYCKEANVWGILCFGMGMTLREGNREYFYKKLDEHFPGLKEKYIAKYRNDYSINSPNSENLMKLFRAECKKNNIVYNTKEIFEFIGELPEKDVQLNLFDF